MAAMKALITGGTGCVGSNLARALLARGDAVRVLARGAGDATTLRALPGAEIVTGDVTDYASVRRAMAGSTHVFHCAAQGGARGRAEAFRAVNVSGTRNCLRAAEETGVERVVLFSGMSVYGPDPPRVAGEDAPLVEWAHPSPDSRLEAERLALSFHRRTGLPVTIIRPGAVYGPNDRQLVPGILRMARKRRRIFTIEGGSANANTAHVANVVGLALGAAVAQAAVGEAFNAVDRETVGWTEFIGLVTRRFGVVRPTLSIPSKIARGLGLIYDAAAWIPGLEPPPLSRLTVRVLQSDFRLSWEKGRRLLGYVPPLDVREGTVSLDVEAWGEAA